MEDKKNVVGIKHDTDKSNMTLIDRTILKELDMYEYMWDKCNARIPINLVLTKATEMLDLRLYTMAASLVIVNIQDVTLEKIMSIYDKGAEKYGNHNWKMVRPVDRYLAAAYRHIKPGINEDDFGVLHLAHFCWNMFALRWFEIRGIRYEMDKVTQNSLNREG